MIRVAAYCRVSTDKDDQLHSFESQKAFFKDYIARHPDWSLAEIYADEGVTGTSTHRRDGFNNLIADGKKGLYELVITKEVSRFSRNILDAIAYTRLLKSLGIGVIFMSDGISTLEPDSELRLSIMASVAQEESRKTSERVKWGQTRQMERGVVFGRSLLGYDVSRGKISIEPKGAAVVRQIFSMFVYDRMGTRAIAEHLTRMGVETKGGKTNWSAASVLKIIKNEKYCGDLLQKKTITKDYLTHKKSANTDRSTLICIRDHHEPIIERSLWEQAQTERRRRSAAVSPTALHGSRYALSGKIRCAACSSPYVCRTRKRSDGTTYRVWQRTCTHGLPQLREDWAASCVKRFIASFKAQVLAILETVLAGLESPQEASLSSALGELRRLAQKNSRLAGAYIDGDIARHELTSLRAQYRQQASSLALRLEEHYRSADDSAVPAISVAHMLLSGDDPDTDFYLRLIHLLEVTNDSSVIIYLGSLTDGITVRYKSIPDINNISDL